jgi:hypothetical protein
LGAESNDQVEIERVKNYKAREKIDGIKVEETEKLVSRALVTGIQTVIQVFANQQKAIGKMKPRESDS